MQNAQKLQRAELLGSTIAKTTIKDATNQLGLSGLSGYRLKKTYPLLMGASLAAVSGGVLFSQIIDHIPHLSQIQQHIGIATYTAPASIFAGIYKYAQNKKTSIVKISTYAAAFNLSAMLVATSLFDSGGNVGLALVQPLVSHHIPLELISTSALMALLATSVPLANISQKFIRLLYAIVTPFYKPQEPQLVYEENNQPLPSHIEMQNNEGEDDEDVKIEGEVHQQITRLLKNNGINATAYNKRVEQYDVILIKNDDPDKIEKLLSKIGIKIGVAKDALKFMPIYKKMVSAILIPRNEDDWDEVPFTSEHLKKGRLIEYIGQSVTGEPVINDREKVPHLMVSGTTGAGKTEAILASIASIKLSGLKTEIIMIDPKKDMLGISCDFYTDNLDLGVQKLENLEQLMKVRGDKYSKANCKNYFEYQRRIDSSEKAIMLYHDEIVDPLVPNLREELEEGEHPRHKRAISSLFELARKGRYAGIFITIGIQDPKADVIKTNITNNFNARLALNVPTQVASRVAIGVNGAETLPIAGGFMYKRGSKPLTFGRCAYISDEQRKSILES